jgi:hypothetical protein
MSIGVSFSTCIIFLEKSFHYCFFFPFFEFTNIQSFVVITILRYRAKNQRIEPDNEPKIQEHNSLSLIFTFMFFFYRELQRITKETYVNVINVVVIVKS